MTTPLSLQHMLTELRAETGGSLSPVHNLNQNDPHKHILRRVQRELYLSFEWPELVVEEEQDVVVGQRYLRPLQDIDYIRITNAWCSLGVELAPMFPGIGPAEYIASNSKAGDQGFPIRKYRWSAARDAIEIWPLPSQEATVTFQGCMKLKPLVEDDDTSTLDGTLIVLHAAAELAAELKRQDADLKLAKAANYFRLLRSGLVSQKNPVTSLTGRQAQVLRPGLDYIPRR